MRTIKELTQAVQMDIAQRTEKQQAMLAKRQKMETRAAELEKEMDEALATGDDEAWQLAREQLSFVKASLSLRMDEKKFYWTDAEAAPLRAEIFNACHKETSPIYQEAYEHLRKAETLYREAASINSQAQRLEVLISTHLKDKDTRSYVYSLTPKKLPASIMNELAILAGTRHTHAK